MLSGGSAGRATASRSAPGTTAPRAPLRRPGVPAARRHRRTALPELLAAQHYRLGWWRLARTELNYRRFFTVSDLIAVRVEHPEVFAATHGKVLELVRDGVVDGLRIDHPDGLADPAAYLEQLAGATGGRWTVVEKILTGPETLPAGWAVAGTTGYDALHRIDGLFTDPMGAADLLGRYRDFAGPPGTAAVTGRRPSGGPRTASSRMSWPPSPSG
ncbi:hypothetical protein NKH18_41260 [Streptomyces sp. M10(2022)]